MHHRGKHRAAGRHHPAAKDTAVRGHQRRTLLALLPAHNEERALPSALESLRKQTRPADLIYVVADNCTDATEEIAITHGVQAFTTQDNHDKKAGALNQALARLLPTLTDDDLVLVMDSDSQLDPGFLDEAEHRLATERRLAGVGGTFRGGSGGGWVGALQRNEYARYARDVRRLKGKVLVLTGTAAVFRVAALRAVLAGRRAGSLPPGEGVYDTSVLTEDNELTLAFLHLGYRVVSPRECTLVTEIMPTWRDLYTQRLRWKRGAVENLIQYGMTRVTWRYWGRQLLTALGCVVTAVYLATIILSLAIAHTIHLQPIWLVITLLFSVERAVTVSDRGWRQMLVGATVVAEMPFDIFLQAVHVDAYARALLRRERRW